MKNDIQNKETDFNREEGEIAAELGNRSIANGEYDKAIGYLKKALSIQPKDFTLHISLTNAFIFKQDFSKAMYHCNRCIVLKPNFYHGYLLKAITYVLKQRYTKAITYFNKAIQCHPENVDTYLWRGITYFYGHQYNKAIKDLKKALSFNPQKTIFLFINMIHEHTDRFLIGLFITAAYQLYGETFADKVLIEMVIKFYQLKQEDLVIELLRKMGETSSNDQIKAMLKHLRKKQEYLEMDLRVMIEYLKSFLE
jgi:tetratricopeptide (TPR) repeat protein